jgi:dienelactone hydrolase
MISCHSAVCCLCADFQYNTRPDSNYGPGRFHDGFLTVANQLWDNGMREALDAAVAAGDVKHIIMTGHSLGGASTTLLSARAQVSARIAGCRSGAATSALGAAPKYWAAWRAVMAV